MASTVFITALAEGYKGPASEFLQHIDYTQLKSAIGTPDLESNPTMTKERMQLKVREQFLWPEDETDHDVGTECSPGS